MLDEKALSELRKKQSQLRELIEKDAAELTVVSKRKTSVEKELLSLRDKIGSIATGPIFKDIADQKDGILETLKGLLQSSMIKIQGSWEQLASLYLGTTTDKERSSVQEKIKIITPDWKIFENGHVANIPPQEVGAQPAAVAAAEVTAQTAEVPAGVPVDTVVAKS